MTNTPSIDGLTALVEDALREVLVSRQMPLYHMMSYHLGWEDEKGDTRLSTAAERSHGVACLMACYAAGGEVETALPAATSVELVRNFCQIHDDVQGGNPGRHDRDAVWWVWGPAQAINAGDGMHALARLSILGLQDRGVSPAGTFRAIQMLDEASLEMCEGRFQDFEAQERIDLSVDAYLTMASRKTGALYSCAMKLGALTAAEDDRLVDSFGVCGARIGLAVQIRDDLRALWGDGHGDTPSSHEVLNKKKLIPVVYALEKAKISEKRRLGDIYFKRVLDPDDVESVRQVLEELGAREACEELVGHYRKEAGEALASAGVSAEGAEAINKLIDSLLDS